MNNPNSEFRIPNSFDQQIEAAFRWLEALEQQVTKAGDVSPKPHRTHRLELLEELSIALEQLQVAGEELHAQNEALAAAQQSLEVERQRYRDLFEFAPHGYLVTDAGGVIQEANETAAALLNREQKFLGGKPLVLFVARKDRQTFHTHLTRLQEAAVDRLEGWELSLQPYNRFPFPAVLTVAAIRDAEGRLVTLHWLMRDIRQRKQAEQALRQRDQQIRLVADALPVYISYLDSKQRYRFFNKMYEKGFGLSDTEIYGRYVQDVLGETAYQAISQYIETALSGQEVTYERHFTFKGGQTRYMQVTYLPHFGEQGVVEGCFVLAHDITERRRMEEALRGANETLERQVAEQTAELRQERDFISAVLDTAGALVIVLDTQGRIIRINRACKQLTGYTYDELQGKRAWDMLLLPEEVERVKAVFEQLLAGHFPNKYENHWLAKDGSRHLIAWSNTVLLDQQGSVEYIIGTGLDITERKQMEEALKTHGRVLDNMAEGVVVADTDNIIYFTNAAFEAMFGYEPGELSGQNASILNLDPARTAARFTTEIIPALQISGVWSGEFNNRKKDGSPFITAARISRLEMSDKTFLVSVQEDITERKRLELEKTQLFEEGSERREQLRALTRRLVETQEADRKAIARELHDQVGQNLTSLDLNLNIIQGQISKASPQVTASIQNYLDDSLALVEHVGTRIRDIMADLRPPILDDYGLMAALRWYGSQLASRTDFAIVVQGDEPTPRLAAPTELALFRIAQEALINVARHAQAGQVTVRLEPDNGPVRLIIADDGLGFEFGGRKSLNDQQTWGLITMAERAEAVGGKFRIESRPGQGTQVIVEVIHSQRGEE